MIYYSEKGEKNYNIYKNKRNLVLGIIGRKNTGKSYILQKITDIKLPFGFDVSTKGLSVLYPKNENQNIVLLDSMGMDTALKEIPGINEFKIVDEYKKKEFDERLRKLEDNLKNANENKNKFLFEQLKREKLELLSNKKSYIDIKEKGAQIAGFFKNKNFTEYFIQKFIIFNSNVLILVVNYLTTDEQEFINKILDIFYQNKNIKKLIIIHNLYMYKEKKLIEDYIEENIENNVYFNLTKKEFININEQNENKYYWIENNKNYEIIHLIMGNDEENTETQTYYNQSAINFIKSYIKCFINIRPFDIKDRLKNFICEISNEIFEKTIDREQILIEDNFIKINKNENKIKESNLNSNKNDLFYRVYLTENFQQKVLCIDIEIPGGCKNLSQKVDKNLNKYVINISGEKNIDILNENKKNFSENIEFNLEKYDIENYLEDKTTNKNGIYSLFYSIKANENEEEEESEENDDEDND
jgi:hypothetical protein